MRPLPGSGESSTSQSRYFCVDSWSGWLAGSLSIRVVPVPPRVSPWCNAAAAASEAAPATSDEGADGGERTALRRLDVQRAPSDDESSEGARHVYLTVNDAFSVAVELSPA
jgi:hypothetical protein